MFAPVPEAAKSGREAAAAPSGAAPATDPPGSRPDRAGGANSADQVPVEADAILPVPPDAGMPPRSQSTQSDYVYRDGAGRVLGYVHRVHDAARGKAFRPWLYVHDADGSCRWAQKGFPKPRPLYGLDRLAARSSAPVLVVEGEKTADAAGAIFADHVAITSPHGANAAAHAEWSPLQGRRVVIWPDNDKSGRDYARAVARLAQDAGAVSVRLVQVPDGLPDAWDLADPVPPEFDVRRLGAALAAARLFGASIDDADPQDAVPEGFRLTATTVEYAVKSDDGETQWRECASRIEVLAVTRDEHGHAWGKVLRVIDPEGNGHVWAMPHNMLAGDGADVRATLLHYGARLPPGRAPRERLMHYLMHARPIVRARAASKTGWNGGVFVFPDRTIGQAPEAVYLQSRLPFAQSFAVSGSLADWRDSIGKWAAGNSRLAFAVSAGFAAAILSPLELEGGGFHLRGPSSCGKTTILKAAGSVWGGGKDGYAKTWRATANGLEGVALAHNDALLCLDELGQIDGREAGQAAYMLANGGGKARARKDGAHRPPHRWRVLILSTGEQSLADKIAEAGGRVHAGQEARLIDLPADAGAGRGAFENMHGFANPQAFVVAIGEAAQRCHGAPIRAFLETLAGDGEAARSRLAETRRQWLAENLPARPNGQVRRAAERFATVAAAGEEAARLGIVPWPLGEASKAAGLCFLAWLQARGGVEASEATEAVRRLRDFVQLHRHSRFADLKAPAAAERMAKMAGYFRQNGDKPEVLILSAVLRGEIYKGMDCQHVCEVLKRRGILVPDNRGNPTKSVRLPPDGVQARVYVIRSEALDEPE